MGDFTINGRKVSAGEWNAFRARLEENAATSKAAFDDGEATEEEITQALDGNKDGKLTARDFRSVDAARFGQVSDLLRKHGFSIGTKVGESLADLNEITNAPACFFEDRAFVLAAVKKEGYALASAPRFQGDREIVLAAVKQDGAALAHADASLRSDREIVLAAVSKSGVSLPDADSSLHDDPEIVLAAVKQAGRALKYAGHACKMDGKIVAAALKQEGKALEFADPSLRRSPKIVRLAIRQDGRALKFADASLRKDREIVLAAVKRDGRALEFADSSLQKDREIVLAAVVQDGDAIWKADRDLQKDREIALAAVAQNRVIFRDLDDALVNDPGFRADVASACIGVLDDLNDEAREEAWKVVAKRHDPAFTKAGFSNEDLSSYAAFKQALRTKHDIEFPERFRSATNLAEVLSHRKKPIDDKDVRPLAIVVAPKTDYNGAFATYPVVDRLMELGYRVSYHEAKDESRVARALAEATGNGKQKASLIVLAGHGEPTKLDLGFGYEPRWEKGPAPFDETKYIDTSDFPSKGKADIDLASALSPGGELLLYSCSNGAGGKREDGNLANAIAKKLPHGARVIATTWPTNIQDISRDEDGIRVTWLENSLYTAGGSDRVAELLDN